MPFKDPEKRKEYARKRYNGDIIPRKSKKLGFRKTSLDKIGKRYGRLVVNGIDRVNNDIGYTLDNCVSCCKLCNRMKNDLAINDFYDHIDRILRHRKS